MQWETVCSFFAVAGNQWTLMSTTPIKYRSDRAAERDRLAICGGGHNHWALMSTKPIKYRSERAMGSDLLADMVGTTNGPGFYQA